MFSNRTRSLLAQLALVVGAAGLLATGGDHLDEYAANGFSTVPTIGTLFLLNFITASIVGASLLLPLRRITQRLAAPLRMLLTVTGIGIAATSLIALWISESSSLFGFTDHGFRPTIVAAIAAEAATIVGLTIYLALAHEVRGYHAVTDSEDRGSRQHSPPRATGAHQPESAGCG